MKQNVYFKGGPVHGEMIEVEVKDGDVFPKVIQIASLPKDINFDVRKNRSMPAKDISYVATTYHLVIPDNKGIPYYEHK
jgi:hypothetical protein